MKQKFGDGTKYFVEVDGKGQSTLRAGGGGGIGGGIVPAIVSAGVQAKDMAKNGGIWTARCASSLSSRRPPSGPSRRDEGNLITKFHGVKYVYM